MDAEMLQRRLDRERSARREAERLLEEKSLELFNINEELRCAASTLEQKGEQLEKALDREREINGLQRQFVSMVSHEFRTPLAIIDGNAQRLLRRAGGNLTERDRNGLQKIRGSVVRLTELMESVLSAARLEDGQIKFEPAPCSLTDMIEEITSSYCEIYAGRRIVIDIALLPKEVVGDYRLLRQVFSNLLSNALKYSPDDTGVQIEGWEDEEGRAVVAVHDQGVGIPEAEQAKLFQRFFRASSSIGVAGTGIGLHMVAHIIELHKGGIEFDSTPGRGSTFRVLLPCGVATSSTCGVATSSTC